MKRFAHTLTRILIALELIALITALLFRATLYWHLPLAPNTAYGIADVLELVLALAIVVLAALSFLSGISLLALKPIRNPRLGGAALLCALLCPSAYWILHPIVAQWQWL